MPNIMQYIKRFGIKIIIPITYEQMQFVIDNYAQLKEYVPHIICSFNYESIDCLNNKVKFYDFMLVNGLSNHIPQRYNNIDIPIKLPCVVKKCISAGGQGSFICYNLADAKNWIVDPDYIVQECINGNVEYCGNFYVKDGTIIKSIYYYTKRKTSVYIQMGKMKNKIKNTDSMLSANLDILFGQIFKLLNYNGFACGDFKMVGDIVKIFEINPRLGGSLVYDKDDLCELVGSVGLID
jgi:predicted ATP-grasp superfamily ATP-dependent carboligase